MSSSISKQIIQNVLGYTSTIRRKAVFGQDLVGKVKDESQRDKAIGFYRNLADANKDGQVGVAEANDFIKKYDINKNGYLDNFYDSDFWGAIYRISPELPELLKNHPDLEKMRTVYTYYKDLERQLNSLKGQLDIYKYDPQKQAELKKDISNLEKKLDVYKIALQDTFKQAEIYLDILDFKKLRGYDMPAIEVPDVDKKRPPIKLYKEFRIEDMI